MMLEGKQPEGNQAFRFPHLAKHARGHTILRVRIPFLTPMAPPKIVLLSISLETQPKEGSFSTMAHPFVNPKGKELASLGSRRIESLGLVAANAAGETGSQLTLRWRAHKVCPFPQESGT